MQTKQAALWVKLTHEQREQVRRVARALGVSMDTYARIRLMAEVEADEVRYSDVIERQEKETAGYGE